MKEQEKIINPFNTGSYARGEGFFGRSDILKKISNFLENPNQNTFVINGQRRIGKTSLLRKIQEKSPEKQFIPIYFDLQDKGDQTLSEILFHLMETIAIDLEIKNIELTKKDFEKNSRLFDKKFLPAALSNDTKIIILFDEFDAMSYYKTVAKKEDTKDLAFDKFVPYLSELIEKRFPIKFVFAIGRTLSDLAISYAPIKKFAKVEKLSFFQKEEAFDLIRTLTKDKILYEDKAIDRIFDLTCGQPYYLQCLASFVFDVALDDGRYVVKPHHIEEQLLAAVKENSGGLTWFWESFKPEEKTFLYAIALIEERGQKVYEETITDELKKLKVKNISPKFSNVLENLINFEILLKDEISTEDNELVTYTIKVPYIQKWLVHEQTIVEFQRNVKEVDKILGHHQLEIGKVFLDEKSYDEAIKFFKNVLMRDSDNFEAQYYLATAMYNSNNYDKDELIEEYYKASMLNPYMAKDAYLNILNEAYNEKNDPKYLERILVEKEDQQTREKLLERWMEKWKEQFQHFVFDEFQQRLENDPWIINNYSSKLISFFEETLTDFNSKELYKQSTNIFDIIPESLNRVRYYSFVKDAFEGQLKKFDELLQNTEKQSKEKLEKNEKETADKMNELQKQSKENLENKEKETTDKINELHEQYQTKLSREKRNKRWGILVASILAGLFGYLIRPEFVSIVQKLWNLFSK